MKTSRKPRCATCKSFQTRPNSPSEWGGCSILCATLALASKSRPSVKIPKTFGCVCHERKTSSK
jgi:hypothetical protein